MNEHYFSVEPAGRAQPRTVEFTVASRRYRLSAATGMFSPDRLDPGTAVLLRETPAPARAGTLLDLGCGYGAITCVLADLAPQAQVWAVDVNARALELTQRNVETLGFADRVWVGTPDDVPIGVRFDEIWSNPPVRIGKQALHELFLRWLPLLGSSGVAWLVVGKNLGADSLQRWLREQGWRCERHASSKGFRVLAVRRELADL